MAETVNSGSVEPARVNTCEGNKSDICYSISQYHLPNNTTSLFRVSVAC